MTILKFRNGKFAAIEGAMDMTDNYPFTIAFRAVGREGTLEYRFIAGFNHDNVDGAIRNTFYFDNDAQHEIIEIEAYDGYQKEIEYFTNCIRENKPVEVVAPEESLYILRVIEAINESLEKGEAVNVSE